MLLKFEHNRMVQNIQNVDKKWLTSSGKVLMPLFFSPRFSHTAPASWEWKQLCLPMPLCEHSSNEASSPTHPTSSKKMGPKPAPNCAKQYEDCADGKPSWRQTTDVSLISQKSSHTVPHAPFISTSTRPSFDDEPPTSLIEPDRKEENANDGSNRRFFFLPYRSY